jgi:hypothetical protein
MAVTAPTTAERIRTTCARAGGAMLAVEGIEPVTTPIHHLLEDGSVAITVPVDGALASMVAAGPAGGRAVLEMTDYAPLPLRYRCARWSGFAVTCRTCRPPRPLTCST